MGHLWTCGGLVLTEMAKVSCLSCFLGVRKEVMSQSTYVNVHACAYDCMRTQVDNKPMNTCAFLVELLAANLGINLSCASPRGIQSTKKHNQQTTAGIMWIITHYSTTSLAFVVKAFVLEAQSEISYGLLKLIMRYLQKNELEQPIL